MVDTLNLEPVHLDDIVKDFVFSELDVTPERVDAVRQSTRDYNKLHEKNAYGFQIEFYIRAQADALIEKIAKTLQIPEGTNLTCIEQDTKFAGFVPIGSTLRVTSARATPRVGGGYNLQIEATDNSPPENGHEKRYNATATLMYVPEVQIPSNHTTNQQGRKYMLRETSMKQMGEGVGKTDTPDLDALAFGLLSNALDWQKDTTEAKEIEDGVSLPLYKSHNLKSYRGLVRLKKAQKEGKPLEFGIATDASTVKFHKTRRTTTAHIDAFTEDGEMVYQAEVMIALIKNERHQPTGSIQAEQPQTQAYTASPASPDQIKTA